jgi:hypothetical protein
MPGHKYLAVPTWLLDARESSWALPPPLPPSLAYLQCTCPLRFGCPAQLQQLLGRLEEGREGGVGQGEHPAGHLCRCAYSKLAEHHIAGSCRLLKGHQRQKPTTMACKQCIGKQPSCYTDLAFLKYIWHLQDWHERQWLLSVAHLKAMRV